MGIADMLIKMGIEYGSDTSLETCDAIAGLLKESVIDASSILAKEYGSFPAYNDEHTNNSAFLNTHVDGLRNSQLLTIAPTGTLSTMLGISGGIEPIFANYYERKTESLHGKDVYYKVYTPIVKQYMEEHDLTDDAELPEYFVTSKELAYKQRIAMQSIWQKYIDASISSTVNLPEDATPEDVLNIYIEAWKAGLKGITVFRDGCRRASILSTNSKKEETVEVEAVESDLPRGYIIETSDELVGKKRKLTTGCGSLHVTAFFDPKTGDLMETYLSKGSTGGCGNSLTGLSRMISLAARAGCKVQDIVDQLDSCGSCPSYAVRRATKGDTSKGSCCPMAVGNAIQDMWNEFQTEQYDTFSEEKCENNHNVSNDKSEKCPQCGEPLVAEGGCVTCKACGWSKCEL